MKRVFVLLSITMVLFVTGCSGAQVDIQDTGQLESDESDVFAQGIQNTTEVTQLLFGTLMFEGTENTVTPEQAAELLPLWKLYRSLLESDITATAEIEAVAKQLHQTMTSEQLATMENQELNREQINEIMAELGIDMFGSVGGRSEGLDSPDRFQPGQGGGPGGGAGRGDGTGIDPEMMATRQAAMEENGGLQRGFNLPLIEALIKLLESRMG